MFRFPPRRILVPLDLSEASRHAYAAAKLAAGKFHARLEAVYCDAPLPAEMAAYAEALQDRVRLDRVESALRSRYPGADALHVARGEPARVILRLARERKPDLIVVGARARGRLSRTLLGSVADALLRYSPAPVLIVRETVRAPRRVLAPIREDKDAQKGLVAAGLVARAFEAKLDVLHVVTDPVFGPRPEKLIRDRVAKLSKEVIRDTGPRPLARTGDPVTEILKATRGADLLVLVSRPKSLLGDLVLGTTAERLARHSRIPMLAMPA